MDKSDDDDDDKRQKKERPLLFFLNKKVTSGLCKKNFAQNGFRVYYIIFFSFCENCVDKQQNVFLLKKEN